MDGFTACQRVLPCRRGIIWSGYLVMRTNLRWWLSLLVLCSWPGVAEPTSAEPPLLTMAKPSGGAEPQSPIYGWIETILFPGEGLLLEAKLDTGAQTSSLDARDIETFERDDEPWVRFRIEGERDGQSESQEVERPILRRVKIRGAGGVDHRYVVRMQLCIGHQAYEEQFTLRDRSRMAYPVLLGRRTLEHLGAVDVKRQHTHEPSC